MPYLVDVVSHFPERTIHQDDVYREFTSMISLSFMERMKLKTFFKNVHVKKRHIALAPQDYKELGSINQRLQLWKDNALPLMEAATTHLLNKIDYSPEGVDYLFTHSVTGVSVPSLDSFLINRLPFRRNIKRVPIFGLGCQGGASGLHRVCEFLQGQPKASALFASVELCTLCLQPKIKSIPNLIATALFGDGASSLLVVGDEHPLVDKAPLQYIDSRSAFFPNTERAMGWNIDGEGFKVILGKEVPELVENEIPGEFDLFLKDQGLQKSDLKFIMAHPGGPKVLKAVEKALGVDKNLLNPSWDNLKIRGNMSSVSVLSIIEDHLKSGLPSGQYGLTSAMGPGFSAELGLFKAV